MRALLTHEIELALGRPHALPEAAPAAALERPASEVLRAPPEVRLPTLVGPDAAGEAREEARDYCSARTSWIDWRTNFTRTPSAISSVTSLSVSAAIVPYMPPVVMTLSPFCILESISSRFLR